MANPGDNYTSFLEAAVPDVDQELDRICMAVLELRLQHLRRQGGNKDFSDGVKKLRDALYGSSQEVPDPFYPGQHLAYWLDVRADFWKAQPAPPAGLPGTLAAVRALLSSARRVAGLINAQWEATQQADAGSDAGAYEGRPSARLLEAQRRTVEVVMNEASLHPLDAWLKHQAGEKARPPAEKKP
jgi:hypothetical protein